MRARKVAILLALVALSALSLFVITLIDGAAFGAESPTKYRPGAVPDTLAYLLENVSIGPDGDAQVEVSAVLARGGSGDLLLPFAFEDCNDFTILSGPVRFATTEDSVSEPTREVLGYRMLNLELLPEAAAGDTVRVEAKAPGWFNREKSRREYGEFAMKRAYVNSSAFVFRRFDLSLQLPPGMLVHSVTKLAPAFEAKNNPDLPYSIQRRGDRGWAVLHLDNFIPADAAQLELRARPARRGLIPLAGGLLAGILYLVFFRDVLKPKEME